ncbi:DUF3826 domain-containing protein [Bythopirellula polymerisocia]|uniref:Uncharacterized protein n=1 Tax=Bythopirellula polymerisocia TaxID=2528003 RepID=A0A5C6CYI3_9BACT|nr:DUF3826 domain-containing protein [Bythopirellula polymerisocia]TWU27709.1 hypothetical protein Pla144_24860 [Bythopirellula polymerisocia]
MLSDRIVVQQLGFVVWVLLAWAAYSTLGLAEEVGQEDEYTQVINARSRAIVDQLGLSDEELADRISQAVAEQYRGLRDIHDSRDTEITELQKSVAVQEKQIEDLIEEVRRASMIEQFQLHRSFVAKLSAELGPEEVNGIKDGMTYGVLPRTYDQYLHTLPNLTEDQKRKIMALLIEAREYAMDAGSSDEKHGWFRKYKGKINNYLSSAGYKM